MAQDKYSVEDRVRVLWEDNLFDGAVIKVHPSGAVDMVFNVDGSIGQGLTEVSFTYT